MARLAQVRVLNREPLPLRAFAFLVAAAIYYVVMVVYVLATISWSRLGNSDDALLFMKGVTLGCIVAPLMTIFAQHLVRRGRARRRRRRRHQ